MSGGVHVSCILGSGFNLAQKAHEKYVGFAAANSNNDRFQVWNKKNDPKRPDGKGGQAFALTNACSGRAMKYNGINKEVLLVTYDPTDDTQFWIRGSPDDQTQTVLEPITGKGQCLTAVLNADDTIDEDTEVMVSSSAGADNQVWTLEDK